MNDYIIDERLMKDMREAIPNKPGIAQKNTMIISRDASLKKGLNDLDHKYKTLEKAYQKLEKKLKDVQDESKQLKDLSNSLSKDLNIIQITNEKIMTEKLNLENLNEENKIYIRKLESRLVTGAKNQYLIEINNKLRKELEEIRKSQDDKLTEIEKLKNDFNKKAQEIKILNKALVS
jgi:predicted  nucleic acid-binding Zn-ribbon protein